MTVTVEDDDDLHDRPHDSRTFPDHQAYGPNGSVTYLGSVTGAG